MAHVLLEGLYRIWVYVNADNKEDAYEKARNLSDKEIFNENILGEDIEDLQPVEYCSDEDF